MRLIRVMLSAGLLLGLAVPAIHASPPVAAHAGTERPILTVTLGPNGRPQETASQEITFDRSRFEAIGTRTIRTSTSWTDGVNEFEGVLVRDVLAAVASDAKASGPYTAIRVAAINDYSYTIPVKDLHEYPVILAFKMNGKALTARDKGPLWVIYPRDEYPELKTKEIDHRMVWQVNAMSVQ